MNLDFPTILVGATLFTGLAWVFDSLLLAPARSKKAAALLESGASAESTQVVSVLKEPTWVEYCKSFFPVILAVLLLRSFLVEPFRIPSGSMMPTLEVGDFILVNKFTYGIRLPVINTKVIELGKPARGDVVVFRYPKDERIDYIKRVVGLPGDRIGYFDKVLYVNGEAVEQQPAGVYLGEGSGVSMTGASQRKELLGAEQHDILVMPGAPGIEIEFVLADGEYFMMGDNRDNSNDSRYWGAVPESHLVGRAFRVWMNWDSTNGGVEWDRIGLKIQ